MNVGSHLSILPFLQILLGNWFVHGHLLKETNKTKVSVSERRAGRLRSRFFLQKIHPETTSLRLVALKIWWSTKRFWFTIILMVPRGGGGGRGKYNCKLMIVKYSWWSFDENAMMKMTIVMKMPKVCAIFPLRQFLQEIAFQLWESESMPWKRNNCWRHIGENYKFNSVWSKNLGKAQHTGHGAISGKICLWFEGYKCENPEEKYWQCH